MMYVTCVFCGFVGMWERIPIIGEEDKTEKEEDIE